MNNKTLKMSALTDLEKACSILKETVPLDVDGTILLALIQSAIIKLQGDGEGYNEPPKPPEKATLHKYVKNLTDEIRGGTYYVPKFEGIYGEFTVYKVTDVKTMQYGYCLYSDKHGRYSNYIHTSEEECIKDSTLFFRGEHTRAEDRLVFTNLAKYLQDFPERFHLEFMVPKKVFGQTCNLMKLIDDETGKIWYVAMHPLTDYPMNTIHTTSLAAITAWRDECSRCLGEPKTGSEEVQSTSTYIPNLGDMLKEGKKYMGKFGKTYGAYVICEVTNLATNRVEGYCLYSVPDNTYSPYVYNTEGYCLMGESKKTSIDPQ